MGGTARDLARLSVREIRERYLGSDRPVSAQLLARLRRDPRQGVLRIYQALRRRRERERAERLRMDRLLHFERLLWNSGAKRVAGVDEAGVGPLAGPVVAGAVFFSPGREVPGVDDSKRLDEATRESLAERIRRDADGVGVGVASVEEIDRLNVYRAALLAMRRAVEALPHLPDHVLVDARVIPGLDVPQSSFQKGDGINHSIAAASIIAKTSRDRMMRDLDREHPGYGLARHKGYGTLEHCDAIRRLGPSGVHRRSFGVIDELCGDYSSLYYDLRGQLEGAPSRAALEVFEKELEQRSAELANAERRKLRIVLRRRWQLV